MVQPETPHPTPSTPHPKPRAATQVLDESFAKWDSTRGAARQEEFRFEIRRDLVRSLRCPTNWVQVESFGTAADVSDSLVPDCLIADYRTTRFTTTLPVPLSSNRVVLAGPHTA